MAYRIFGYDLEWFGKKKKNTDSDESIHQSQVDKKSVNPSFTPPDYDDGAVLLSGQGGGSHFSYGVVFDPAYQSDAQAIYHYREMAMHPEIDQAIDDIVNEAIVSGDDNQPVRLVLDEIEDSVLPEAVKNKMYEEFDEILSLLRFRTKGWEIFRKWYIDGRLYYHKIIDTDAPEDGIIEIRPVDSANIKKVREITQKADPVTGGNIVDRIDEYYIYTERSHTEHGGPTNQGGMDSIEGVKVAPDAITYCHSGILTQDRRKVLGHLHKAIKPLNQLRMLEDAVVIYRISRAPERRIFYVDVGSLPKGRAEQYVKEMMDRYRTKLIYDPGTGEIVDDKKHMSMLEDFWMPRREGGKGTEIATLDGGQTLGEIEDVEYFLKKLYKSLSVPYGRLDQEAGGGAFGIGRSSEISRDEIKFNKLTSRLRSKFSEMFLDMLKTQLVLKNIVTEDDWMDFEQDVTFDFVKDNHFAELKEAEIWQNRMNLMNDFEQYTNKYFSNAWLRKNILKQNDEEIEELDTEIGKEQKMKRWNEDYEEPEGDGGSDDDGESSYDKPGSPQPLAEPAKPKRAKQPKADFEE